MALHGVWRVRAHETMVRASVKRGPLVAVIVVMVLIVGVPLTITSVRIAQDTNEQASVRAAGRQWADGVGWELTGVDIEAGKTVASFEGPTPLPTTDDLPQLLRDHSVDPGDVRVELTPRQTIELEG